MSLVMMCDDCRCVETTPGFDEELALRTGWTIRDYGHSCKDCSELAKEVEFLDDSAGTDAFNVIVNAAMEIDKKLKK